MSSSLDEQYCKPESLWTVEYLTELVCVLIQRQGGRVVLTVDDGITGRDSPLFIRIRENLEAQTITLLAGDEARADAEKDTHQIQ